MLEAEDASGNRLLNIHFPWSNGRIYWDAGYSNGYDRIDRAAAAAEYEGQWNHWVFTKDAAAGKIGVFEFDGGVFADLWATKTKAQFRSYAR